MKITHHLVGINLMLACGLDVSTASSRGEYWESGYSMVTCADCLRKAPGISLPQSRSVTDVEEWLTS